MFKPVQIGFLSLANENISNKQAPSFKKEKDELRQKDGFDHVVLAVDSIMRKSASSKLQKSVPDHGS